MMAYLDKTGQLGCGLLLAALALGCQDRAIDPALDFPASAGGKADVFGRSLVGVAAPYEPDSSLEDPAKAEALRSDVRLRRETAWNTVYKILEPVPLLGLVEVIDGHAEVTWPEDDVPSLPRFQTWYGVEDFKRVFQHLYSGLGEEERSARVAFGKEAIAEALAWNARAVERSDRWPLERYLQHVNKLSSCPADLSPAECAALIEQKLAGAASGTSRMMYSPGTINHLLENYAEIERCLGELDQLSLGIEPASDDNFTACFAREFPTDSVLVKAHWVRADFGRDLPAFDTDADAMRARLSGTADWGETGDRRVNPESSEIYTIRLRDGSLYRLAGLHIMTKELRHWQWVTLWWSDKPDVDFGADRPESIRAGLPDVWSRYKMCAVSWFDENDPQLAERFHELPTLSQALDATSAPEQPSWCSNPYIEHGRNNAGTNCIGCHQHGGATVAFDRDGNGSLDPLDLEEIIQSETLFPNAGRSQIREQFPADYTYSFNRIDDLSRVLMDEIELFDRLDGELAARVTSILAITGNPDAGEERFSTTCAGCHGAQGQGGAFAPSLFERVPALDDQALLRSLLRGRGGMPAWGPHMSDDELADVFAFLRQAFLSQQAW